MPKPHFETTVSIGKCIRTRKLHNRKSAPLFSVYTLNMKICHYTSSLWLFDHKLLKAFYDFVSLNYLLSYRLLSKNIKIIPYRTMTLPIALYGYETLFLTNVKVFENRVLTEVFGPKREEVIVE